MPPKCKTPHFPYPTTEVTAGLAESNGSLPPGGWFENHLRADCLYTGISLGPTLGNEYGRTLPFIYYSIAFTGYYDPGQLRHADDQDNDLYVKC